MSALQAILERRRLVVASALLVALAGVLSWLTMPREEDPQFPQRSGMVLTMFPGSDAETVERLVVEPLEEALAEVEEIDEVSSTARAGAAIVRVELLEDIYDTESAWDEVRDAVERARVEFPRGVAEPRVEDDLLSQEAIVLAITGSADPLALARGAEQLKRELLSLDTVKQVNIVADPGEQITIEYDDAVARRLGVDPLTLGATLARRSSMQPGGLIHLGAKSANLRPQTEFESLAEIRSTPVMLPSGSSVPLSELARVRRGPSEPPAERMYWQGEPAVGLGVVPKDNLDRIEYGRQVRERVAEVASWLEPLKIEEVVFQPDQVESRLKDLTGSLRLGILIVAIVLILFMGPRLGFLVALVVPLVTFGAIAIFDATGGILHQISIAALVIALGMLVDNAIVVSENIQWRLDRGRPIRQAAIESVRELALPLGTATGTTLAAFVPLLLSKGGTADFTRSIPVLIMLTLSASYLFAVLVTPVLAEFFLRRRKQSSDEGGRIDRLARAVSSLAVRRSRWVLTGAAVLLLVTLFAAGRLDQQFFPAADRPVVVVSLEMPEGTHLEETDAVTRRFEAALASHPEVTSVASFIGRAAPRFYYNLLSQPNSPHRAQMVAEVTSLPMVERLIVWVRDYSRRELPEAEVVARRLEQGPPIEAPIEVRVLGADLEDLEQTADAILAELRQIPGTRDTRHDLGLGVPTVVFDIDDAAAARHGLSRSDVATVLRGRTLGAEIGQYRVDEDPVPIVVRSSAGQELPASDLATIDVATPGGEPVPLSQLARLRVEWRPAAIYHLDRSRTVKVLSQLAEGVASNQVLAELEPRLAELDLPPGVRLELGGELEESGSANAAILGAMPLGLLLLLFFLLAEFNSFRRVVIVLMTVPLAATGVVPGLLLSGQAFGFMSMLGVVSLVGIVVNNAIVLLDVIESLRTQGLSLEKALAEAVRRRTRPIVLTMVTTVAGLLPLAFSATTLWPPLAWAMISGLIASTLLTLLVIPALYKVLFTPRTGLGGILGRRPAAAAAAVGLVVIASTGTAEARPIEQATAAGLSSSASEPAGEDTLELTLEEAVERAVQRPQLAAAERRASAAALGARAERRAALLPTVGVAFDLARRDRDFAFSTPLGDLTLGERTSTAITLEVTQPVLDPSQLFFRSKAARSEANAAAQQALRVRRLVTTEAANRFLQLLAIDANLRSTAAFIASLEASLQEVEERVAAGKTLEAEALKVRLDLESAVLDQQVLEDRRRVAAHDLGRVVGHDGPVEPRAEGAASQGTSDERARSPISAKDRAGFAERLIDRALAGREDINALNAQRLALDLRASALRAERLPKVQARASWVSADGDPFRPEELFEGGLGVRWNPFAAGTRAPRIAALEAEREALDADLAELRYAVSLQVRDALAQLASAEATAEVRRRGVELATETLRVERERNRVGRATTNDLLDAEAALRRQRTESDLAQIAIRQAWFELDLAVGADVAALDVGT
ncbi:MAG: efflux RND transporter permease subunit [Acidobacteriota bacterium]